MFLLNYLPSVFAGRGRQVTKSDQESFQILRINARSDHPVRNGAGEFIFGDHILWERDNTSNDDKGSSAPNVFAYDFDSPLAWNSLLNITIKVTNHELFGTDYRLRGTLDGSKVYESDVFTITSADETTVAAHVVEPHSSAVPFSFDGDFIWTMERQQSEGTLRCARETRLELYWIWTDIHEIFLTGLSGIPIDFLRSLPLSRNTDSKFAIRGSGNWPRVTQLVYSNYSKIYDTVAGAPRFGCNGEGGRFNLTYYVKTRGPGAPWGSLQPIVNCYDQAAMVQVSGSVSGFRPTWLFQGPNGYINATYLVGIRQLCNNPFFNGTKPPSPPNIGINDKRRQPFGNHVFNGFFDKFRPNDPQERIYDATGGPHTGSQTPAGYLRATIDTMTTLYRDRGWRFGTVADIKQCAGVTGKFMAPPRTDGSALGANMKKFLQRCRVKSTKPYSQIRWDDVGTWTKLIFGNSCEVGFQSNDIGNGIAETLWHLTGVDSAEGDVVVRVRVETRIGEDRKLDFERSSEATYDDFIFTLKNNQRDFGHNDENLESLWAPAPFGNCTQYAVQYAANISRGRILLVSGNFMIDISGGSCSAALEPVARKLLAHTTVDEPLSLHVPIVIGSSYDIPVSSKGLLDDTVSGLGSPFDFKCQVDGLVTVASADIEEHGLLLGKYQITLNEADATSVVIFSFVTRAIGTHVVDLHFQQAQTMSTSVKTIHVTVTDT